MKRHVLVAVKVYVFTWFLIAIWFIVRSFTEDISIIASFKQLFELLSYKQFIVGIHIFFGLLYLLYIVFHYFYNQYKSKGLNHSLKLLTFRLILPLLVLYYSGKYIIQNNSADGYIYKWNYAFENTEYLATTHGENDGKQRGMSVFGWHNSTDEEIGQLVKSNIEWVAVIPFFYQKDDESQEISSRVDIGKWTRRDSTFINAVNQLHNRGIKVMIKPHLWVSDGWRSDIKLDTREQWKSWFSKYSNLMLHYATMAEETNAELLCIGTELRTSIEVVSEEWKELIVDIRKTYKGQLTYVANWHDEYEHITFWNELDYIGIQAYFPLTEHKNPQLSEIISGWNAHKKNLGAFSKKYNKPILFTEVGYRSDASTTVKPWEWNSLSNLFLNNRSTEAQQLAYEAMFNSLWNEPWFAGCYIWQWDFRTKEESAKKSFDFSPRFKPAENIIAKWYGNYNSLHE